MSGSSETFYFTTAVDFFHAYNWVYNFKATDILLDDVLQSIPLEFQTFFKNLDDNDDDFRKILQLSLNVSKFCKSPLPDIVSCFKCGCNNV